MLVLAQGLKTLRHAENLHEKMGFKPHFLCFVVGAE